LEHAPASFRDSVNKPRKQTGAAPHAVNLVKTW
jgi:hypothetical protein